MTTATEFAIKGCGFHIGSSYAVVDKDKIMFKYYQFVQTAEHHYDPGKRMYDMKSSPGKLIEIVLYEVTMKVCFFPCFLFSLLV